MVPQKAPRHFLTLKDINSAELQHIITRAIELKAMLRQGKAPEIFNNKVLAMIFEKNSTRTRVSFESGVAKLGGHAIFLSTKDSQLGRGEPIEDAGDTAHSLECLTGVRIMRQHTP